MVDYDSESSNGNEDSKEVSVTELHAASEANSTSTEISSNLCDLPMVVGSKFHALLSTANGKEPMLGTRVEFDGRQGFSLTHPSVGTTKVYFDNHDDDSLVNSTSSSFGSVVLVSNTETKGLDQTTAIITHSSRGHQALAASCNMKLEFTSAFNGLASISKIQDD